MGTQKIDNILYDVVAVLHEKSKGLQAYDKYEKDVQNHPEVKRVLEEIRRSDEQSVKRLEDCLTQLCMDRSGRERKVA
jgi:hypothetical protein